MEINIGIVGDMFVGKTSLITKFVNEIYEKKYSDIKYADYFIEIITNKEIIKSLILSDNNIVHNNLSLKIIEANDILTLFQLKIVPNIIIFTFDLMNIQSLVSLKEFYRQLRSEYRYCDVILLGTKYDLINKCSIQQQNFINKEVLKFVKIMNSIVFYISVKDSNMDQLFQYILNRVFNLHSDRNRNKHIKEPIILN